MEKIRSIIKEIVEELIKEATPGNHWQLRIDTRLKSPLTEPPFPFHHVENKLKELEKIDFEGQKNIAVNIYSSKEIYTAMGDGKEKHSRGNTVWGVIRGNELDTLLFDFPEYKIQNTQYTFKLDRILDFVRQKGPQANGKYFITDKDLENGLKTQEKVELKKQFDLPVVELTNGRWYIDSDNERLIYFKNTKKSMSFDEAFDQLPETDLAKLTSAAHWEA